MEGLLALGTTPPGMTTLTSDMAAAWGLRQRFVGGTS